MNVHYLLGLADIKVSNYAFPLKRFIDTGQHKPKESILSVPLRFIFGTGARAPGTG